MNRLIAGWITVALSVAYPFWQVSAAAEAEPGAVSVTIDARLQSADQLIAQGNIAPVFFVPRNRL